ncbi:MAG: RNA methyltransferase [Chitinophagaceae bacterium]|nr:RNA methyltransferase [Chitinophagaceae bacterium]
MVKMKVKYIQSLSHKKLRDEDGVFVAEGPKIINELLSAGNIEPVEIFAVKEWMNGRQDSLFEEIEQSELERISFLSTPNQVLGIFKKAVHPPMHLAGTVTLMADNIQDPGNLGTIIRCADWFGIKQVICSKDCADVYNPKTVQSTMGSISRVAVHYEDLAEVIRSHPSTHVYAATLSGKNIHEMKPLHHGIILMGNESKGISADLLKLAQEEITIPRIGAAESLNAAVATGIILSHLVKGAAH